MLSGRLRPTAALISSVIILTVFAQPCWHMFHNLRRFCFNLPNTLRCGHSHWLDLLIQLVFFDAPSHPHCPLLFLPSPPLPSPPLLSLAFTVASNLWSLLTIGPGSRNQSYIPGIVCKAPDAVSCRLPAQCDCWNVQIGLMSFITNRTKIRLIYFNWILTHIWVLTSVSILVWDPDASTLL